MTDAEKAVDVREAFAKARRRTDIPRADTMGLYLAWKQLERISERGLAHLHDAMKA